MPAPRYRNAISIVPHEKQQSFISVKDVKLQAIMRLLAALDNPLGNQASNEAICDSPGTGSAGHGHEFGR
jgi:hypothetical protein